MKTISGAIKFRPESNTKDGGRYTIVNAIGQGCGIPTRDITPDDLRAMADHLESMRKIAVPQDATGEE